MGQVPIVCTHQTSFSPLGSVSPNILMTTSHDQCHETILQIISLCLVQNSCMNKRAVREMPIFYPKMPIVDMWTAKYSHVMLETNLNVCLNIWIRLTLYK